MRRLIKTIITGSLQTMLNSRFLFPLFNSLYEHGSWKTKDFIYRNVKPPGSDKIWDIHLLNGKKVHYHLNHTELISWHFATSYLWHDPALSHLEHALNEYYPSQKNYLDIGANQGLRAMIYLSTGRKSYLFEPNKKLWPVIEKLIDMNAYQSANLVKLCLSENSGNQTFYISSSSYLSSLSAEHAKLDTIVESYDVEVQTLDAYVEANQLNPGIIKLDVETFELPVLKGAGKTLDTYKPSVYAEILEEPVNKKAIFDYMESKGYKSFAILHGERHFLKAIRYNDRHETNNYFFMQDEGLKKYLLDRNLMYS